MKKYIYLLMAVCTLSFAGCNDDDDPTATALEIVESEIGFDAAGGNGKITLRTSASTVQAVSDKGWLTISKATPESVTYSLVANSDALQRAANITVTAGGVSRVVTILQSGAMFDISSDPVAVSPSGETPSYIAYDTSLATMPEVTVPSDAKWLKASVEEGRIKLEADLNYTGARNTVIKIVQGWKPVEIPITQEMVDLVDTKQIARDREAADIVVTPTEYLAMASATWDVQTADDWITLNKEADKFTVTLTENTSGALRRGTVKVVSGEGTELFTIPVSQKIYSYEFFIGNWTMVYNNNKKAAAVTLTANEDRTGYIMSGLALDMELGYVDSGSAPKLTWVMQYLGSANASTHYFLCPWYLAGEGNFTWLAGAGADLIYSMDETNQVLVLKDNGVGAASDVITDSFLIAVFNTFPPSSGGYVSAPVQYPYISGFARTPDEGE